MTVLTPPKENVRRDEILDLLAVLFGQALRGAGVAASPAEVIEMAIVGAGDLDVLRAALRSVSVKYGYETEGFDHAFDVFFLDAGSGPGREADLPRPRGAAADLPDDVVWDEEFEGAARRIGADEHTEEIGDLMAPDPGAGERHGESAHREENDFTVSAGAEQLGVDPDSGSVSGGVTYTVEIDSADSATVGELVGAAARVESTPLGLTGAAAILAARTAPTGTPISTTRAASNLSGRWRRSSMRSPHASRRPGSPWATRSVSPHRCGPSRPTSTARATGSSSACAVHRVG